MIARLSERVGVVLFQLGGPDSLKAVEPFLFNLFCDPDIIDFPFSRIGRRPLAKLISQYPGEKGRSSLLGNRGLLAHSPVYGAAGASPAGQVDRRRLGCGVRGGHALLASVHGGCRGSPAAGGCGPHRFTAALPAIFPNDDWKQLERVAATMVRRTPDFLCNQFLS